MCKCHSQSFGKTCFFGLHVDFQSKISKEQASNNVSFSSCVSRYSSPTPQPPNQQSTRNHYCTMWLDGVKVQDLTNQPKKLYRQDVTKWSFPTKITSPRRASSVTKNVGIIPKKMKAFHHFTNQTNSRKTQDT